MHQSLDFKAFRMIQEYFSQTFEVSTNYRHGDLICWGNQFCRSTELFGPPLLYFNFKSFNDQNSLLFFRFERIQHDSGVFFLRL